MIGSEKEERMEISVMLTSHLVTIKKPLSFTKKVCKLQKKPVIRPEKEEPMEISVMLVVRAEVYERRKGRAFGVDFLLRHFMMQLLDPVLTCLDLKLTSWSLFLMVSCALPHGP